MAVRICTLARQRDEVGGLVNHSTSRIALHHVLRLIEQRDRLGPRH
jgi:hypothetical protein